MIEHHAPTNLTRAIQEAINRFSAENGSDTPDFILAEFMVACLDAFDRALRDRERWYGRAAAGTKPAEECLHEIWNAAIEAAAKLADEEHARFCSKHASLLAGRIRALKRKAAE